MADVTLNEQHLQDIAYAIREKLYIPQSIRSFSKTYNVSDDGTTYEPSYGNYQEVVDVVTIPGAARIVVELKAQTESTNYDWVQIREGVWTEMSDFSACTKYGGTTVMNATLTFNGDSVSFFFRSDSGIDKYYGYYAKITAYDAQGNAFDTEGAPIKYRPCDMAAAINSIPTVDPNAPTAENAIISRAISGDYINSDVTNIGAYAFYGCNLLDGCEMPNVTEIGNSAFYYCSKLVKADFPQCKTLGGAVFGSCYLLEEINFPQLTKGAGSDFYTCVALTRADLPALTEMSYRMFSECSNLDTLILRNNRVVTGATAMLYNTKIYKGTGYIYVPKDLISSYKSSSYWNDSVFANQFRAIEDYPDICG